MATRTLGQNNLEGSNYALSGEVCKKQVGKLLKKMKITSLVQDIKNLRCLLDIQVVTQSIWINGPDGEGEAKARDRNFCVISTERVVTRGHRVSRHRKGPRTPP